ILKMRMDSLCVGYHVAGHLDLRIESQDVAPLFRRPKGVTGNHWRPAMVGEPDKSGSRAGFFAKKIDEYAFFAQRILIDQDTYRCTGLQGSKNLPRCGPFFDDMISA